MTVPGAAEAATSAVGTATSAAALPASLPGGFSAGITGQQLFGTATAAPFTTGINVGGLADVLTAVGTTVGAIGQLSAGQGRAAEAEFQAQIARRNAQQAQLDAAVEESRLRRDRARRISSSVAGFSGAGLGLTGSALDVILDQQAEAEQDAMLIQFGGRTQSQNQLLRAASFGRTADAAITGSRFQAGATILSGVGRLSQRGVFRGILE